MKHNWTPINKGELEKIINNDLKLCTPEQLDTWNKYSINPVKAEIERYGGIELVFLVAIKNDYGMYYEDVEEGFNISPINNDGLKIHEHWCNQDDLQTALNRWLG
ncbi:MAG: hypothetical protein ACRBB3_09035 [Alphaproteobacteria bacterium]